MKISKLAAALTLGFIAAAGTLVPIRAEAAPADVCLPGAPLPCIPTTPPTLPIPTCLPGTTLCLPTAPGVPTLPIPAPPSLPGGLPAIPGITCANDGTPNPLSLPSCSVVSAPGGTTTQPSGVSGSVKITGKPRVGKKLHADLSGYSAPGYTISYQWLRNGKAITVKSKGKHHKKRPATKPSYKLVGKDRGKQIVLLVTASKSGSQNAVSYAVAPKIKKAKRP